MQKLDYSPLNLAARNRIWTIDSSYFITGLILLGLLLVYANGGGQSVLLIIFLAAVATLLLWLSIDSHKNPDNAAVEFALQNGYTPQPMWLSLPSLNGQLYGRGVETQQINYISGIYNQTKFQFYNFTYKEDTKDQKQHSILVLELRLGIDLPHVFIDNKYNNKYYPKTFARSLVKNDSLTLGGNLKRRFTIYSADDYELEALLLADNQMLQTILSAGKHFDIEFIDGRLYAYAPTDAFASNADMYKQGFAFLHELTAHLPLKLQRWRFTRLHNTPIHIKEKQLVSDQTEDRIITAVAWMPWLIFIAIAIGSWALLFAVYNDMTA